ncbi:nuclear transport factor 2 family protein, partial [Clostridioides difficile]|nr:nuclear transport factor 2 family protein [Clostridioides difficile]
EAKENFTSGDDEDEQCSRAATHSAVDIANLLYRYAELLDAGDLPRVAELFRHARIKTQDDAPPIGADELLALFSAREKRYL